MLKNHVIKAFLERKFIFPLLKHEKMLNLISIQIMIESFIYFLHFYFKTEANLNNDDLSWKLINRKDKMRRMKTYKVQKYFMNEN